MHIMTDRGWQPIVCVALILPPEGNSGTLLERWLAMARGETVGDYQ